MPQHNVRLNPCRHQLVMPQSHLKGTGFDLIEAWSDLVIKHLFNLQFI